MPIILGRGTVVQGHGFEDDDEPPLAEAGEGGWRARRRAEKLLRRKLFGRAGAGLPTVMVGMP